MTRITTFWRLLQAASLSLLIAAALLVAGDIPYPDPCRACDAGQMSWWLCVLAGCW